MPIGLLIKKSKGLFINTFFTLTINIANFKIKEDLFLILAMY